MKYYKKNPDLTILSNLYGLLQSDKGNPGIEAAVANIAWTLEFDLDFDSYGYHSLAELAGHKTA